MKDDKFEELMSAYSHEKVDVPKGLTRSTLQRMEATADNSNEMLPYLIACVIFINMFISISTGAVLYLMRPIELWEWMLIGSVYSSFNALFYGLTYAYREKVSQLLSDLGGL